MCLHIVVELHFEEVLGLYLSHVVDNELVVEESRVHVVRLHTGSEGDLGTVQLSSLAWVRTRLSDTLK